MRQNPDKRWKNKTLRIDGHADAWAELNRPKIEMSRWCKTVVFAPGELTRVRNYIGPRRQEDMVQDRQARWRVGGII